MMTDLDTYLYRVDRSTMSYSAWSGDVWCGLAGLCYLVVGYLFCYFVGLAGIPTLWSDFGSVGLWMVWIMVLICWVRCSTFRALFSV